MAFEPSGDDLDLLFEELGISPDEVSGELLSIIQQELTEVGHSLDDATAAEIKTLANTALLNAYRAENVIAAAGTDPDAWVYLGPNDDAIRPFCKELVNKYVTPDGITKLDNGTGMDPIVSGGGYNCRHVWAPLYGTEQLEEFPPASVEAANQAAAVG